MSIQKLITINILFSQGKPNNTHSSKWSKLEISNSLIFELHLNQYFQNLLLSNLLVLTRSPRVSRAYLRRERYFLPQIVSNLNRKLTPPFLPRDDAFTAANITTFKSHYVCHNCRLQDIQFSKC